jgi:hypothetical protein
VGRDGWFGALCVGRGVRCRLYPAPHLRGYLLHVHVDYSAVCAVGWRGEWSCVGAVDMGVRGWGVMGGCVHSVWGVV